MGKTGSRLKKTWNNTTKAVVTGGLALLCLTGGIKKANAQQPPSPVNFFVSYDETGKGFNALKTPEERSEYIEEKVKNDWTKDVPPSANFNCDDVSLQLQTNSKDWGEDINLYKGYRGRNLDSISNYYTGSLVDMGYIGLQMAMVTLKYSGSDNAHAMNAVLIGDNALDLNNWKVMDLTLDEAGNEMGFDYLNMKPGDWITYPKDCEISINYGWVLNTDDYPNIPWDSSDIGKKLLENNPMLSFKIEDGNPTLIWTNPWSSMITQRESNPPQISRTSPLEEMIYSEVPFKSSASDENFRSFKYSLDNGNTWTEKGKNINTTLNLPDGEYKLLTKAEDWFLLETKDSVNFRVDGTPVEVSLTSPEDGLLTNKDVNMEYHLKDNHLDLNNSNYKLNGITKYFSDSTGTIPLNSKEGDNKLEIFAKDSAGNTTYAERNFSVDKTPPEIIANAPVNDSLEYILRDKHLDLENSYFVFNNGEKNYFADSTGTIPLNSKPGDNKLEIFAKDLAGNNSNKTINYHITGTDDQKIFSESKSLIYPNPVRDYATLKYSQEGNTAFNGRTAYIDIWDVSGRNIRKIEDSDGNGETEIDMSDLSHGIYLYTIKDKSGKNIYTGKIAKE